MEAWIVSQQGEGEEEEENVEDGLNGNAMPKPTKKRARQTQDKVKLPLKKKAKEELLGWWKNNASKYPILSLVTQDVLAVLVTYVASESAFSTGGRVIDPFRSSLRPNIVEALICSQDWLRSTTKPIDLQASLREIEEYDEIDAEIFEAAASSFPL